jgi:hypothetical protein
MAHVMFPCLSELNALFGDTSVLVRDLLRNHFHYELPERSTEQGLLAPESDGPLTPPQKRMLLAVVLPVLDMYSALVGFLLDVVHSADEIEMHDAKVLAQQAQRCFACYINGETRHLSFRAPSADILALDSLETAIRWCFGRWLSLSEIGSQLSVAQACCLYPCSNAPVTRMLAIRGYCDYGEASPFAGMIGCFSW